ncbi:hypothetical protein [Maribacter sp. 2210JD10-5]|uniref:hypothetical protein n=1 Tax=Maribacter sp. 2210JD10-5 TaxID=3386272 RepID=UPI0039BD575B
MKIDNKNKLLFLGLVVLLLASYYLAINKTLLLRKESQRLNAQVEQFKDIPKKLSVLGQRNAHYDSLLVKMDLVDTSVQNNLLRTINQEATKNKVIVMDFNQPHIYEMGDNSLHTYSFNLNGNYTDILKVVHAIEQKGNFGEVVHIDFQKKKNYRTNRYSLGAIVFVQQVK